MAFKPKSSRIPRGLTTSKAWYALRGVAPQVFTRFLDKRRMKDFGRNGREDWVCTNNGEFVFTYAEAAELGITQREFVYAIDKLIEYGFIDIEEYGGGTLRKPTLYRISERWRKYGTDEFEPAKRRTRAKQGYCDPAKRFKRLKAVS